MKRLLLTGGSGYLGQFILAELAKTTYEVVSLSRHKISHKVIKHHVPLDVSQLSELGNALDGIEVDAILHVAA